MSEQMERLLKNYNVTTEKQLLREIASVTEGRMLDLPESVFDHNLLVTRSAKTIWWTMLVVAICLFPLDIFIRRVMIDYGKIFVWARNASARIPLVKRLVKARIFAPLKKPAYGIRPGAGGRWEQALMQEKGFEASGRYDAAKVFEEEKIKEGAASAADKGALVERADSEYIQRLFAAKKRARRKKGLDAGTKEK